jgi:serine-type D-Ala-D-Ala carboxypeptidase (penicillin-binding protein 5/6)
MPYTLFQGGARRRRVRRRRPPLRPIALLLVAVAVAYLALRDDAPDRAPAVRGAAAPLTAAPPASVPLAGGGTAPTALGVLLNDPRDRVPLRFKTPPRAGLLFDLDTGRVLWRRQPTKTLPIASLTKMMTALVVVDRVPPGDRILVTKQALAYKGSAVGVLPLGKRIGVNTMLHGLLLPSGNDAAIALAQHAGGTVPGFVKLMNEKAQRLGLGCTRFSSPDGFRNRGNHSCAADLAAIGRAVLRQPRLARIVRRREAALPFPIKGGRLFLYNNNPLLRQGYRGTTGLKTGYTDAAGRCLVATVKRGRIRLGVVLLHSPDPGKQAMQLLDRGFRVARGT